MPKAAKINWMDREGFQRQLLETGANKLKYIAAHAPKGRLEVPAELGPWRVSDVRAWQDYGLWLVDWVEPGDTKREHGWVITGLTDLGREVLSEWRRLVEEGGGLRGPRRGETADRP